MYGVFVGYYWIYHAPWIMNFVFVMIWIKELPNYISIPLHTIMQEIIYRSGKISTEWVARRNFAIGTDDEESLKAQWVCMVLLYFNRRLKTNILIKIYGNSWQVIEIYIGLLYPHLLNLSSLAWTSRWKVSINFWASWIFSSSFSVISILRSWFRSVSDHTFWKSRKAGWFQPWNKTKYHQVLTLWYIPFPNWRPEVR